MWDCSDLSSATGLGPSDRSVINRSVIHTRVIDTKYEEWRDIDTGKNTGSYIECDKERYTSFRAFSLGSCHFTCREVCLDQIVFTIWQFEGSSVGLALPGLGGIVNLLKRRLKPITHDRMSRSAISVSKHCSKILGLKTGGSSLCPSGHSRLPETGLNNIP